MAVAAASNKENNAGKAKALKQAPSTWLTRAQASDLLGCSQLTLANWEAKGYLTRGVRMTERTRGKREVIVYDPVELSKMPRRVRSAENRTDDEICARVFERFENGERLAEIVIAERITIEKVRAYHLEWLADEGNPNELNKRARDEIAAVVGPFANASELVERVKSYAARVSAAVLRHRNRGEDDMSTRTSTSTDTNEERVDIIVETSVIPGSMTDAQIEAIINAALDAADAPSR